MGLVAEGLPIVPVALERWETVEHWETVEYWETVEGWVAVKQHTAVVAVVLEGMKIVEERKTVLLGVLERMEPVQEHMAVVLVAEERWEVGQAGFEEQRDCSLVLVVDYNLEEVESVVDSDPAVAELVLVGLVGMFVPLVRCSQEPVDAARIVALD